MTFRSFGRAALALVFSLGLATLPTSCGGGHAVGYTYVLGTSPCAIYAYSVNSDNGALAAANNVSTQCPSGITNPISAAVSPDYKFLFVLFGPPGQPGTIQVYGLNQSNGAMTPVQSYSTGGFNSSALAIDPGGKYLYAVDTFQSGQDTGMGVLSFYTISSGALAAPSCSAGTVVNGACTYPVGYAPAGVNQLFNAQFVYVTNQGDASLPCVSSTVSGFSVSSDGLTPITFAAPKGVCNGPAVPAGSLFMGTQPYGITSDPTSSFVYITDAQQDQVYANQVNFTTGYLSTSITGGVTGQGYPVQKTPRNVIVDPRGLYVYVTNSGSNTISAFTLNRSSGALASVSGSPYATGALPLCLGVDPLQGEYLYTVNQNDGTINGYKLTGNTGQLAFTPNSPYRVSSTNSSAPSCLVVAANGATPIAGTP